MGQQQDQEEIKRILETNKNVNTTIQNLWDTRKAILRREFIALQAHLTKQEKAQINNLTSHLKELGAKNKAQSE